MLPAECLPEQEVVCYEVYVSLTRFPYTASPALWLFLSTDPSGQGSVSWKNEKEKKKFLWEARLRNETHSRHSISSRNSPMMLFWSTYTRLPVKTDSVPESNNKMICFVSTLSLHFILINTCCAGTKVKETYWSLKWLRDKNIPITGTQVETKTLPDWKKNGVETYLYLKAKSVFTWNFNQVLKCPCDWWYCFHLCAVCFMLPPF